MRRGENVVFSSRDAQDFAVAARVSIVPQNGFVLNTCGSRERSRSRSSEIGRVFSEKRRGSKETLRMTGLLFTGQASRAPHRRLHRCRARQERQSSADGRFSVAACGHLPALRAGDGMAHAAAAVPVAEGGRFFFRCGVPARIAPRDMLLRPGLFPQVEETGIGGAPSQRCHGGATAPLVKPAGPHGSLEAPGAIEAVARFPRRAKAPGASSLFCRLAHRPPRYARVSGLYLMRCGWSASAPRRRLRSAS
jgi:hypothetical protein